VEKVAVKIYDTYKKKHKNIESEIAILEKMKHPHIVKFKEAIETKDRVNLVLEYVDGISLLRHLKVKSKLAEAEAKKIFHQLLQALAYCHS
jgi:serine/threonine protein kinase